jgi:putative ABC transport system permease protein
VAGGVVGAAVAHVGLDGYAASTLGMGGELGVSTTTPQVSIHFLVSGSIMIDAALWVFGMGLIAGLYPALRAARMPIAMALRDI